MVKNASGQFVYASTVARFLSEARNANPRTLLNIALNLKPAGVAGVNPFAHLDALYTQILRSSPDPALVVKWLWFIKIWGTLGDDKPPPASVLNFILETFEGEADHLLGDVHSLVKVPSFEDIEAPYGFYHKSLFDYLEGLYRAGPLFLHYQPRSDFVWEKYLGAVRGKLALSRRLKNHSSDATLYLSRWTLEVSRGQPRLFCPPTPLLLLSLSSV